MKSGVSDKNVFKNSNMNSASKLLHKKHAPLQTEAFSDKENVASGNRISGNDDNIKQKVVELKMKQTGIEEFLKLKAEDLGKQKSQGNVKLKNETSGKLKLAKGITAEDLTSDEGPSEKYYQVLSEKMRSSMRELIEENYELREKLEKKEKENEALKEALQEATNVVELLNEIIAETDGEGDRVTENSTHIEDSSLSAILPEADDAFGADNTVYDDSDDSILGRK